MTSRWAVLLCKFKGDDSEPLARSAYDELFTGPGLGRWNMPDYFRAMSHGQLELKMDVHGWMELAQKQSEYVGSGLNPQGRLDLLTWAREAAAAEGIDLSPYANVVVVTNAPSDLFGGGAGVVCYDDGKDLGMSGLAPGLLGQEIGHGFGLAHSRLDGTTTDYTDPFDVMSNANRCMAPNPYWTTRTVRGDAVYPIGPGLNAGNMTIAGWVDQSRVRRITSGHAVDTVVELRPLHRHDLPGYLVIDYRGLLVEFRHNSQWDAGIGAPMVLVHSIEDGITYLVKDQHGKTEGAPGSTWGPEISSIRVESIDAASMTARIRLKSIEFVPEIPKFEPSLADLVQQQPHEISAAVALARVGQELTFSSPTASSG
jgi:hypothetical protein